MANPVVIQNGLKRSFPKGGRLRHNVFIFGGMGFGKSSFINSVLVTNKLRDSKKHAKTYPPGTDGAKNSVTVDYGYYTVPLMEIYLFDTYGWETALNGSINYSAQDFKNYLRGRVRIGESRPSMGVPVQDSSTDPNLIIDSCLFFIHAKSDTAAIQLYWNSIREFYDIAIREGVPVIFVLSQADKLFDDSRNVLSMNSLSFHNSKEIQEKMKEINSVICTNGGPDRIVIMPQISYTITMIQNDQCDIPLLDELTMQVLKKCTTSKSEEPYQNYFWDSTSMTKNEHVTNVQFYQ